MLFLLWGTSGLVPSLSHADTVTLDNGDRLSGRLISLNGETLELATADAGTLTVSPAHLAAINPPETQRTTLDAEINKDSQHGVERDSNWRLGVTHDDTALIFNLDYTL